MSIPIFEDEIIRDPDGTIRLKKDGTILEKNGVWRARNYYLTTREEIEELRRYNDEKIEALDRKTERKARQNAAASKADKIKAGTQKVGWLARMRARLFGNSKANGK